MKPTVLDRAISWIAPAAGARRLRHRASYELMKRAYAGAAMDRSKGGWVSPATSADAEIGRAAGMLRDRMRDLVRNNPYAANALSALVTHAIGDGILPRAKSKRVNDLFAEWVKECDADGRLDFFGIQALAVRQMMESGDGFIRRRRRLAADGLTVPLQLQIFEADQVDATKDGPLDAGKRAIQGIEFDGMGRRTAYWLYSHHPGDVRGFSMTSKAVPADDVVHVFEKQRQQVRGVPWGTPAISDIYSLGEYETAELIRKRLEACAVGVVTGGEDDGIGGIIEDAASKYPGIKNHRGEAVERLEPGAFLHAHGGKTITFHQPAATGSYDSYKTSMLHTISAGWRVPHALVTGRLDGVNYTSSKLGLESFKLTISQLQWHVIIPMLCEPIWKWFLEAAYLAGKISHTNHPAEWTPPRFYSADPARDVKARIMENRSGLKPMSAAIAETGYTRDEILAQYAEDNKEIDRLELVFDTDPRRMSGNGQVQTALAEDDEDNDSPAPKPKIPSQSNPS